MNQLRGVSVGSQVIRNIAFQAQQFFLTFLVNGSILKFLKCGIKVPGAL